MNRGTIEQRKEEKEEGRREKEGSAEGIKE
jgi:hypothetical protein